MEFYFRTSPTPWIPAKAADFILSKTSTQLSDPTSLPFNGHQGPSAGAKAIGMSIWPLTPSNFKVNNDWN
jgi:hypothetical protein